MVRTFKINIEYDDDWLGHEKESYLSEGVLLGYVNLKIGKYKLFNYYPWGINNPVVEWVRSTLQDHPKPPVYELNYSQPMFFCAGSIQNKCGCYADFSVVHENSKIVLSDFYGCKIKSDISIVMPWEIWANEIYSVSSRVLKKCLSNKKGIKKKNLKLYQKKRVELKLL